jgi:hypothetical protein
MNRTAHLGSRYRACLANLVISARCAGGDGSGVARVRAREYNASTERIPRGYIARLQIPGTETCVFWAKTTGLNSAVIYGSLL